MTRRTIAIVCGLAAALTFSTVPARAADHPKVLVLGVDGLDPKLLRQFADEGELPNLGRLMREGDFKPLTTSMPPLSPIAWSTFITGMDPGGHAIFDFIHRDPETIVPYLSMAREIPASKSYTVGSWVFPLGGGGMENLRKGKAFWEYLGERKIPHTLFRMPSNFPPVESKNGHSFSGMGTPDILGTPGTFHFYTSRPVENANDITGGKVELVDVTGNKVQSHLFGPPNPFRRFKKTGRAARRQSRNDTEEWVHPDLKVDFTVYIDPEEAAARVDVQGTELILREGEWSPWFNIVFETGMPLASVSANGRFYLKQVRPDFQLYVTPLQIDPANPGGMVITSPAGWSSEVALALGPFYTQNLPEDTKALEAGVLTGREFWDQAQLIFREREVALDYFLKGFDQGLLFFYFSSIDQGSHMLWRYSDSAHPGFVEDAFLKDGIRTLYRQLDASVGRVLAGLEPGTTLIIMSDHGFCPFYRGVNLNTWLLSKGYVTLRDPSRQGTLPLFGNVDWSKTQAYAVGLNGLYVNLMGREKRGIVTQGPQQQDVLDRLERDLLELRDPSNGEPAVTLVVRSDRDFHGQYAQAGPDIVVGYNWGYRSSWTSPLGWFPNAVFEDNDAAWSGDHSVDYRHVPGVLLSNRRITLEAPSLQDLTVAILDEYGIAKPEQMIGQDCLGEFVDQPVAAASNGR